MRTGKDPVAKKVQAATGARYQTALNEVRRRERRGELAAYLIAIKGVSEWIPGQPMRCVTCLMPYLNGEHDCPTPRGRDAVTTEAG